MTPDQISALTAIAAIISKIGTWPIGSVVAAVVFGPWIMLWFFVRSIEKRHDAAVQMYEDNVKLVERCEKVEAEQADTIRLTTAAITELTTYLRSQVPCHERMKDMVKK